MPDHSLRSLLRTRTAATHERLDATVGHFSDLQSYTRFAWHSLRFRSAMEPALVRSSPWAIDELAGLIAADLRDLDTPFPPSADSAPTLSGHQALGAAYVLEGSALGARLLFRRAQELGLGEAFGARHLARQSGDHARWRDFLSVLEAVHPDDHPAVLSGAEITFRFALATYSEPAHERA